jgi:hypothetical protein
MLRATLAAVNNGDLQFAPFILQIAKENRWLDSQSCQTVPFLIPGPGAAEGDDFLHSIRPPT